MRDEPGWIGVKDLFAYRMAKVIDAGLMNRPGRRGALVEFHFADQISDECHKKSFPVEVEAR